MKSFLSSVMLVCALGAFISPSLVSADSKKPFPYSKVEVEAFVDFQFDNYFVDCSEFISSFSKKFQYCDGQPCLSDAEELLTICEETEGAQQEIIELNVLPASFPDPFNPDYSKVVATGLQTVYLPLPGTPGFPAPFPLCFNFAIEQELKKDKHSSFGFSSKSWVGFYTVTPGPCE